MNYHESGYTMGDDDQVGERLEILATKHCRLLLRYFREVSEEVASVCELADEISEEEPERATIQLHHSTLPRLEDAGVIEYDPRHNTVRYQGHPDLEVLLETVSQGEQHEREDESAT